MYLKWELLIEAHPYLAFVVAIGISFVVGKILDFLGGKHGRNLRKSRRTHQKI